MSRTKFWEAGKVKRDDRVISFEVMSFRAMSFRAMSFGAMSFGAAPFVQKHLKAMAVKK